MEIYAITYRLILNAYTSTNYLAKMKRKIYKGGKDSEFITAAA